MCLSTSLCIPVFCAPRSLSINFLFVYLSHSVYLFLSVSLPTSISVCASFSPKPTYLTTYICSLHSSQPNPPCFPLQISNICASVSSANHSPFSVLNGVRIVDHQTTDDGVISRYLLTNTLFALPLSFSPSSFYLPLSLSLSLSLSHTHPHTRSFIH